MKNPNPIRNVRSSLSPLIKILAKESYTQIEIKEAWLEVTITFWSQEFQRYIESFGKLGLMIPEGEPGVEKWHNIYLETLIKFSQYNNTISEIIRGDNYSRHDILPYIAGLSSTLEFMEDLKDNINKIYRSKNIVK